MLRRFLAAAIVGALLPLAVAHADNIGLARDHYREGTKLYDLGHYLEAANEYEKAYQAKEDPALLFNIGQAYRGAADYTDALRAFRSFVRRSPDAAHRAEAEARIAELQQLLAQPRQTELTSPDLGSAPAATAPERPRHDRRWLWVGGAAAVVVVGVAVGLGVGLGAHPSDPHASFGAVVVK